MAKSSEKNLESEEETPLPAEPATNDVTQLKAERDELFERLARVTADFQNSRKRLETDLENRVQYANANLIRSLLPVIDNFERALAVDLAKTDSATMLKGLQLVHDQWMTVLKSQLVSEIAPQPGDAFDPAMHQALMQNPDEKYANRGPTVVQLLQKGYMLNDRVLRPAQVAVNKTN
ncbi:MAG TPA: nucleotide exchange factor GrpE [Tepidisphaeraceae bacterium]|jgi:molecular chaperone GrpE